MTNKFTVPQLAKFFDHTALKSEVTNEEIKMLCDEAKYLGVAAVCINPIWIPVAKKYLSGSSVMPITVVGFPLGAMGTESKVFEARHAVARGALEIDMVLSVGELKSNMLDEARRDINEVKKAIGQIPLKVIFETSLLTKDEIFKVAKWCAEDGIDFVKTSTGFGARGASLDDIRVMKEAIASVSGAKTKIKASGGIRTLKDTIALIDAGASRIGASATKSILNELNGGAVDLKKGY